MKLDPDCTRAILLAIEATCDIEHDFDSARDIGLISGRFPRDVIQYHVRQCYLSGFLYEYEQYMGGDWTVSDLTPKGHEFLANIREDALWEKVKIVSTKVGSKSLNALAQIASAVVTEIIRAQLRLP